MYCLGDIIGYGADPSKCIEIVKKKTKLCVAGNHDHASIGKMDITYFNPFARFAIEWTAEQISKEDVMYLNALGFNSKIRDFMIVHSSPFKPEEWDYILVEEDADKAFKNFDLPFCFVGHSHQPLVWEVDEKGRINCTNGRNIKLRDASRYIINTGSVGQPRDGDPRSSYAIFDTVRNEISILRIDYDIEMAQKKMISAGLPEYLIERLSCGV